MQEPPNKKNDNNPSAFVSYARSDTGFRKQLTDCLLEKEIDILGDWDLVPGPDFLPQIMERIAKTDVFLFLMSASSLQSVVCTQELEHANRLGKKIIPIKIKEIPKEILIRPELSNPQWCIFENNIAETSNQISSAINTNFDLLSRHTSLAIAGEVWDKKKGPLLRGRQLRSAIALKKQLENDKFLFPSISPFLENYIHKSKKAQINQWILLGVAGLFIIAATLLLIQNILQTEQLKRRKEQAHKLALASQSVFKESPSGIMESLLLAEEAMKINPSVEADLALRQALKLTPRLIAKIHEGEEMVQTSYSVDGKLFAALDREGNFFLWNTDSWTRNNSINIKGISNFIFTEKYLAVISTDSICSAFELNDFHKKFSRKISIYSPLLQLYQSANIIAIREQGSDSGIAVIIDLVKESVTHITVQRSIISLAISGDGKYIATGSEDDFKNIVELWTINGDRKLKFEIEDIYWVSFSQDSKCFFAFDGGLHGWTISGTKCPVSSNLFPRIFYKGPTIIPFTISPKGKYGLAVYEDRIILMSMDGGTIRQTLWSKSISAYNNGDIIFTNDDSILVIREGGTVIRIWDSETGTEKARYSYDGKIIRTEALTYDPIKTISISPDGKFIAIATQNSESSSRTASPLFIFETKGYTSSLMFWNDDIPRALAFAVDSGELFFASGGYHIDGFISLSNMNSPNQVYNINTRRQRIISSISFGRNADIIALANHNGDSWVWKWKEGKLIYHYEDSVPVNRIAISRDGNYLATALYDNYARVWDINSKKQILALQHYDSTNQTVNNIEFSPSGDRIITCSDDNTACIWSFPEGKKIATLKHDDFIMDATFDPSGRFVGTAGWDNRAGLWNAGNGKNILMAKHEKLVNKVAFSPAGKYFAAASGDCCGLKGNDMTAGKVTIWRLSDKKKIHEIEHPYTVWDIAFSPDGKFIASSCYDSNIRIWEISSGKEISRISLNFSTQMPKEILFSPDGKYIAAPGEVYLWKPADLIKEAESRKTRELSAVERKQYLNN